MIRLSRYRPFILGKHKRKLASKVIDQLLPFFFATGAEFMSSEHKLMPGPVGRPPLPTSVKRSVEFTIVFTMVEATKIREASAARGTTVSAFVRDACARMLTQPDTKPAAGKGSRPGGTRWLFQKIKEEISLWEEADCPGTFVPFKQAGTYIREITATSKLNEVEAFSVIRSFVKKNQKKLDKLASDTKKRWTRQNLGRVPTDTSEDEANMPEPAYDDVDQDDIIDVDQ